MFVFQTHRKMYTLNCIPHQIPMLRLSNNPKAASPQGLQQGDLQAGLALSLGDPRDSRVQEGPPDMLSGSRDRMVPSSTNVTC